MAKLQYEEVETIARGGRWYSCSYGPVQFQVRVNSNMTANVQPMVTALQACCVANKTYEFSNLHPRARLILFAADPHNAEPFVSWFRKLGLEESHAQAAGQDLLEELLAVEWVKNAYC